MKAFLKFLVFLAVLAAAVWGIGALRARETTTQHQALYRIPAKELWDAVTAFDRWADWNPSVQSIEPAGEKNGHPAYTLHTSWGAVPMEISRSEPYDTLETLVETKNVRSLWTWSFEENSVGTALTITQEKRVPEPFFRALLLFHDDDAPIVDAMKGLANMLKLEIKPKKIESR